MYLANTALCSESCFLQFWSAIWAWGLIMLCSAVYTIVIYAPLRAKHVTKVRRTTKGTSTCLSKLSSPPEKAKAYYSKNYHYERIRKRQQLWNDKRYPKVDADPHQCFNHKASCIIVHFCKSTPYDSNYYIKSNMKSSTLNFITVRYDYRHMKVQTLKGV